MKQGPSGSPRGESNPRPSGECRSEHEDGENRHENPGPSFEATSRSDGQPDHQRDRHAQVRAEMVGVPQGGEDPHSSTERGRPAPYHGIVSGNLEEPIGGGEGSGKPGGPREPHQRITASF